MAALGACPGSSHQLLALWWLSLAQGVGEAGLGLPGSKRCLPACPICSLLILLGFSASCRHPKPSVTAAGDPVQGVPSLLLLLAVLPQTREAVP